jgi:signal transduction histidine kinase
MCLLRRYYLSITVFFISIQIQGQNIDSLRKQINNYERIDTAYVLTLAELAYQLYSLNPDSSLFLAKRADSLATHLSFGKGKGRALRVIGIYYWTKGNYKDATANFQDALQLAINSKDKKGIASCYTNLGVVYRNQGNNSKALEYFFESLKIRESINDRQGIATTSNNLGLLYETLNNFNKALEYFNRAIVIQKEIKDKAGLGRSYLNIGLVLQSHKKYDKAIESYLASLNLVKEIGDQRGFCLIANNLAQIYIRTNKMDEALPYLKQGLAISTRNNFRDCIGDIKQTYAYYFNEIKQPRQAIQYADEACKLGIEIGKLDVYRNGLYQRYLAFSQLAMPQKALENYEKYIQLTDSLHNDEIIKNSLANEYELREEKYRNEQVASELQHRAENERQKRITNTVLGITFTSILGSLLIFMTNRKIRKQRKKLQLQQIELSIQNDELSGSREEISAQRDFVAMQNKKLEEAQNLIEQQNQEIRKRNETLEIEIANRTKELVDYNQQLEQFAFVSAHNLRAPVARILGLGNLLSLPSNSPQDLLEIGEKMTYSSLELDQVIKDINQILQIKNDNTSLLTKVNPKQEIENIKSMLDKEIKENNIEIYEDLADTEAITTVKTYFHSIFLNLISNAIKYRDFLRPLVINIKSKTENDYVVITISDNGIGIDLNAFGDKLFKLYNRFHTHVEGKGIGLYLVKTQLTILGGKIEVESEPQLGTTFHVYLKNR